MAKSNAKKKVIAVKAKKPIALKKKTPAFKKSVLVRTKNAAPIKFPIVTIDTGSLAAIRNVIRTELDLMLKTAQEIENRAVQKALEEDKKAVKEFAAGDQVIIDRLDQPVDGLKKRVSAEPFA